MRARRRRARSRERQRRARRRATANSRAEGSGAGSRTICVRHQVPSPSRSGSWTTRPAASRSSSQRCTLRRCERTKRARPAPPMRNRPPPHHRRQPDDELRDRRRVPRRPPGVTETEQVPLDRVGAGLEPIVARRRGSRGHSGPGRAARTRRGGPVRAAAARSPAGTNGATTRRVEAWSSGTASARRRHGSTKHCARERTLAAQLKASQPPTALSAGRTPLERGRRSVRRHGYSSELRDMWAPSPSAIAPEWPAGPQNGDRAPTRSFSFRGGRGGGPREHGRGEEHAPPNREQAATDCSLRPLQDPLVAAFRCASASRPKTRKPAAQDPNSWSCATAFTSGRV